MALIFPESSILSKTIIVRDHFSACGCVNTMVTPFMGKKIPEGSVWAWSTPCSIKMKMLLYLDRLLMYRFCSYFEDNW